MSCIWKTRYHRGVIYFFKGRENLTLKLMQKTEVKDMFEERLRYQIPRFIIKL